MNENKTIKKTLQPWSRERLAHDLRQLGIEPGMTLIVHSSMSAIGWMPGGPVTIIQALMDVLTPNGTLVMPTHSGDNSDPAKWQNPPVPEAWWPIIRKHMPAYDPKIQPTRGIGRVPEQFRTWPGVLRSDHPQHSFAAWGRNASLITSEHSLDNSLGEHSPLARLYDLDAWVLLLGVGYGSNTSFHLAEYRIPNPPMEQDGAAILEQGKKVWKILHNIVLDEEPFPDLGHDFERKGQVTIGFIGQAESRLFRQKPAVDFAVSWLQQRQK